MIVLRLHNRSDVKRAGKQQPAHQGHARGGFVTHQLRGAAQRADQRIVAVGGPASQHNAKNSHGADADNKKNADVDTLRDLEGRANGQTGYREQSSSYGKHRGEPENELIRIVRDNVFLDEQLYSVGDGLEQTMRSHAHRAKPCLHVRHDLAFH